MPTELKFASAAYSELLKPVIVDVHRAVLWPPSCSHVPDVCNQTGSSSNWGQTRHERQGLWHSTTALLLGVLLLPEMACLKYFCCHLTYFMICEVSWCYVQGSWETCRLCASWLLANNQTVQSQISE